MKRLIHAAILSLAITAISSAQNPSNQPEDFAATVRELKGVCLVRDSSSSTPRKIKATDKLQSGQQVRCEARGFLKFRFRASGSEKEIKADESWHEIPNVPATALKASGPRIPGRSKGDPPGADTSADEQRPTGESNQASSGFDDVDIFWKHRKKYFLIVAATKTAGVNTDLPFTKVDAKELSDALEKVGYEKLAILVERQATEENFITELKRIRSLTPTAVVVVYYSGHAATDPQGKDLWLQLYGQEKFGDHRGISVSELVGASRGNSYKGELMVILDACYSGQGALTSQLSLREAENTVIFASSAYNQPSYSKVLTSGIEMSAFTYYLTRALGPDWTAVDGDSDGIILYSDLRVYIENQLLEQLRDRAILGSMQPQLFGHSSRNWAAYDARYVRNFNTQPRRTLRLERAFQLQDPEKLMKKLTEPLPPNSHAYLRALKALADDSFDEAWQLLDVAEKEAIVPLAEIHWARAGLKIEQGQLGGARDWFEKALEASVKPNADLIAYTAMLNFSLGNWARAEELLKQVLDLPPVEDDEDPDDIDVPTVSLFFLTMINIFQGDATEGDLYLKRLKQIDPKKMEADEKGSSAIIPFLEVLADAIQGRHAAAKKKLEEVRSSDSFNAASKEYQGLFRTFFEAIEKALSNSTDASSKIAVDAQHIQEWTRALEKKDLNNLVLLLGQLQILAAAPEAKTSFLSPEIERLLTSTVDFAHKHRFEKQTIEVEDSAGRRQIELAGTEKNSAIESATLLTLAAQIYLARGDLVETEKLLKESLGLQSDETAVLGFSPAMQLGQLYTDARRFPEAENLYNNLIAKLQKPLGEKNFHVVLVHEELGEMYDDWERWDKAEQSYRKALQLSISAFGSDSLFADEARENLATFLANRGRDAEAVPIFEEAIRILEANVTKSVLIDESLGERYLGLGKSYHRLRRYEAAEKALEKTAQLFSARNEPDVLDVLSTLHWQWATANVLKKTTAADGFYRLMVQTAQAEIARPRPNDSTGEDLLDIANWFRNASEWTKAEQLLGLTLSAQEKIFGAQEPEVAQVWESWAELNETRMQYASALTCLNKAKDIYQKQPHPDVAKLSLVTYNMGFDTYLRQDFESARVLLKQSIDLLMQIPEPLRTDPLAKREFARFLLGRVERVLGNYDAAKKIITTVLETDESALPRESADIVSCLLELANIWRLEGNAAEAEQWLNRAEGIIGAIPAEQTLGRRAKLAHERGMLALSAGKDKLAEPLLREAVDKAQKTKEMDPLTLAEFIDDYARFMRRRRQKDKEATQLEQQARQIRDTLRHGK